MHFLIGLVIVLGIIYGMIVSPPFRAAVFVLFGLGALGALIIFVLVVMQSEKRQTVTQPMQPIVFALTKITLSDMIMSPTYGSSPRLGAGQGSWTIDGIVTNNSNVEVRDIEFEVT